jgi:DNA polymerase I
VDCRWVQGAPGALLKARVEQEPRLYLEVEHFDWIVFLPLADGFGAYNRYFGRLADGSVKVRGIAARRHDTPEFICSMQKEMLTAMGHARTVAELDSVKVAVRAIYQDYVARLPSAPVREMAISRRISRLTYAHRCIEGAAVRAYREQGASVAPGMKIHYVVTDAKRYQAEPVWAAKTFDQQYYRGLLDKAWAEIAFAFRQEKAGDCREELAVGLSVA